MERKKSFYACILLLLFIVIAITLINENIVNAEDDIVNTLKNEITPIKTVEAGDDFSDLMPLKELLKDKKLIGMGDATYGTSEFFKMKHRMFKFLVEEMGFRALAMDLNFADGETINKYILSKAGDEESVMNSLLDVMYKADEIKQMLNWMKEYNIKVDEKDKIRVYGFNINYNKSELQSLKNYLNIVKPDMLEKYKDKNYFKLDETKEKRLDISLEEVYNIIKEFEINKEEMIRKSSNEDYENMMISLEVIKQHCDLSEDKRNIKNERKKAELGKKDRFMANNLKWIINKEVKLGNDKVMIWSDNKHIMKGNVLGTRFKDIKFKTMGNHLNETYGRTYCAIGFDFYKGKFNSFELKELKDSERQTLAATLNKIEEPIFYLNITKALTNKEIKKWFENNNSFIKFINGAFDELKDRYLLSFDATKDYDGLIFIKETTESKTLVYNIHKQKNRKIDNKHIYKNTPQLLACMGVIVIAGLLICFIIYGNNRGISK